MADPIAFSTLDDGATHIDKLNEFAVQVSDVQADADAVAQAVLDAQQAASTAATDAATETSNLIRSEMQGYADTASGAAHTSQEAMLAAAGMVWDGWQGVLPITAQALHRSPNAVTAMCIYDTSLDSDGGAWTERCAHTSWYNEPLAGRWLGAHASEAAARAVEGAATGDYFQRTTDGRFWSLNAGSGVTEVYRGNKRAFPRVVAILSSGVASGSNVHVIYDLTEPGCPMWLVLKNISLSSANFFVVNNGTLHAEAIAARNGVVALGLTSNSVNAGLIIMDFPRDRGERIPRADFGGVLPGGLAIRNEPIVLSPTGKAVARPVSGIAMAVMPGTPVDPQTGLPTPTMALATGSGVYVIKPDGTILWSALTNAFASVSIDSKVLWAQRSDSATLYSAQQPAALGASFTLTAHSATTPPDFNVGGAVAGRANRRFQLGRAEATALRIARPSLAAFGNSPAAKIAPTFNAGYLLGDIRRAYLAGAAAGAVGPSPELVLNGTFDTNADGWTPISNDSLGTVIDGKYRATNTNRIYQDVSVTPGKTYLFTGNSTTVSGSGSGQVILYNGATVSGSAAIASSAASSYSLRVTPSQAIIRVYLHAGADRTVDYDNISLREVVADRSYRGARANIHGTITATPSATGADLVGYSGWSASDYLREPFSADLDFGTGPWSVGAWIRIPAANAAAGVIAERRGATGPYITLGITAGNLITATAYDGTTTRTVTGSVAYNIDQRVSVRAAYIADGALALHVNGRQVASATGAPLLTLNSPDAVLTIGNSYALDAPFPGSIALLKLGATVPTAEQSAWIYEQERQLFREGAKCVLPDSSALVDLAYDEQTDTWIAASAANVSEWSGLVRTRVVPSAGGNILKVSGGAGGRLVARSGVGVDVDLPGGALRAELAKSGRRRDRKTVPFEFDAVAGQTRFALPTGYTVARVAVAGAVKREGTTKDYVLEFDGFVETVVFAVAPGDAAWVRIDAWED